MNRLERILDRAQAKQAPYTFRLKGLPVGEPVVQARATYQRQGREVSVESPYRTLRVLDE